MGQPSFSNGVAYGDLDNDGDLDMVVNNLNDECFVYRNEVNKKSANHFIEISFDGKAPNNFGIGAMVTVFANGSKQVKQLIPVRSFQSCMDPRLVFGLGKNSKVDSMEIVWPDLSMQTLYNTVADHQLRLHQSDAKQQFSPSIASAALLADLTPTKLHGNIEHKENDFIDFDVERLLPHMLSREGPCLAVADVNGDGKQDFFMGGAAGEEGKLFLQRTGGGFEQLTQAVFVKDKSLEDVAAAFFDVDNDGDPDLIVGSGGYQYDAGSSLLRTRLYTNDGKGHFSEGQSLNNVSVNAGCIAVSDFDKDGYADVFIGGRAVSGQYGKAARSFLLHNEKGKLIDITPSTLKEPGMVTDACWTDINKDGNPDLMLVGEWMPITFFINNNGRLEAKNEVPNSSGWWNSITQADLDKDGNMDFVLGNWGLNSRFKASKDKPMHLYVNDFDGNGTSESIITYYWPEGKSFVYPSKSDLTSQLPPLRKRFLYYKDFAGKTMEDFFGAETVSRSQQYQTEELQTAILWGKGRDEVELEPLPVIAQVAPVYAIVATDFDKDGNTDLFLTGNMYDVKPDIGRLDANDGILLKGDGRRNFRPLTSLQTGIHIKGQVRDAVKIDIDGDKQAILLAGNNASLLYLGIKK